MVSPELGAVIKAVLQGELGLSAVEDALVAGADPNCLVDGQIVLCFVIQSQGRHQYKLLHLLLRHGADVNVFNAKGVTPLHLASFQGQHDLVSLLLDNRADPNAIDRFGQTPIFFADNELTCQVLVTFNADVNIQNHKGQSALHLAAHAGLQSTADWLCQHMSPEVATGQDMQGRTAHYCSVRTSAKSVMKNLESKLQTVVAPPKPLSPRLKMPPPPHKSKKEFESELKTTNKMGAAPELKTSFEPGPRVEEQHLKQMQEYQTEKAGVEAETEAQRKAEGKADAEQLAMISKQRAQEIVARQVAKVSEVVCHGVIAEAKAQAEEERKA
eukprot:gnl/MRDRNA2_/MRDRNA2_101128_c0_seq1.p1 gnl/MRDRNA2_/MRDRNA2_101128_c0~~gnl/MRDRNA2_/MRDRNA2_101128_c0_seq1.p1  ORF type:complete len:328 (-),score=81.28 gnl/MRDRNA2_/MRDRNA2_101128_c0_seq1:166-1149(-)